MLDAGGDGDATGVDASALVHKYGRSFGQGAPELALEYYMQARAEPYNTVTLGQDVHVRGAPEWRWSSTCWRALHPTVPCNVILHLCTACWGAPNKQRGILVSVSVYIGCEDTSRPPA